MVAELQTQLAVQPRLIKGSKGIFDVHVDGKLVFSKHDVGRFPTHGEVLAKLTPQP